MSNLEVKKTGKASFSFIIYDLLIIIFGGIWAFRDFSCSFVVRVKDRRVMEIL